MIDCFPPQKHRLILADSDRTLSHAGSALTTRSGHLTVSLIVAIPVVVFGGRCGVKPERQCRLEKVICRADLRSR
jgi:hypothetical protein